MSVHGKVMLPLNPISGESLRGYAVRVARYNRYPEATLPFKEAGIATASIGAFVTTVQAGLETLAQIYGCSRDDLDRMTIKPGVRSTDKRAVGAAELRGGQIRWKHRAYSPASFENSRHHRLLWDVKPLGFCRESWEILLEQCPQCERRLGFWEGELANCRVCGTDLRTAVATSVPSSIRSSLEVAADLILPADGRDPMRPFPSRLRVLPNAEVLELCRFLGSAINGLLNRHLVGLEHVGALASGVELLRDYPNSLERIWARRDQTSFWLLSQVERGMEAHPSYEVRSFLKATLNSLSGGTRYAGITLRDARASFRLLTVTEAAARMRVPRAVIRKMIDLGDLPAEHVGGNKRKHAWLTPEQVDRCRERRNSMIAGIELGRELGLPVEAATALAQACLTPRVPLKIDAETARGPFFHRTRIQVLRRKLERRITRVPTAESKVHLREIDHAPSLPMLAAAALYLASRRELSAELCSADEEGFNPEALRIADIDQHVIRDKAHEFQAAVGVTTWSQALAILGCGPNALNALLGAGIIPRRDGVFDYASLVEIAQSHISPKSIEGLCYGPKDAIRTWLRQNDIRRLHPNVDLYLRADVEPRLEELAVYLGVTDERLAALKLSSTSHTPS